jgi:hypothetical protein
MYTAIIMYNQTTIILIYKRVKRYNYLRKGVVFMNSKRMVAVMMACLLCLAGLSSCTGNKEQPAETSPAELETSEVVVPTDDLGEIVSFITDAVVNPAYKPVLVDGNTANTNPATAYRGLGVVTGNNTSRLLMDYKEDNPEQYWEVMNYLFRKDTGAGLTYLKIEFGTDVNSSSGTEPSTMRSADEAANVCRGAGFMFAADALSINPDIAVDLLRWGEPKWVTDAFSVSPENGHAMRYKWYKETIDAAYDEFGIVFSYISADANEPNKIDVEWIIYFSDRLKSESNAKYDYGSIKIVASDEVGSWKIADEMMNNERLRDAVDVLACHYNTHASNNAKILNDQYGKEVWYSEGIAPINIARLAVNSNGSGLNGVNGSLDVANRIINSYYNGKMTLYAYQPAIAAYYSGAKFFPKALIYANEPWSGAYEVDAGVWISLHFTAFIEQGWQFIDSACFGDGKENHAITETTNNYMTAASPDTGDYSIVLCNDSPGRRDYTFTVANLTKAASVVYVWETIGPANETELYDTNWLRRVAAYRPQDNGDGTYSYSIEAKPFSIITITTLDKNLPGFAPRDGIVDRQVLAVPYSDDFEYGDEFIARRGGTPKYTTDQGGAFEVYSLDGNTVLMQMITADNKPTDWRLRGTPNPITSLGDDRWSNYSASIDFRFDSGGNAGNYIALGVRYLSAEIDSGSAESGYSLRVYQNGEWDLRKNARTVMNGELDAFDSEAWNTIKITANNRLIIAELNGVTVATFEDDTAFANSGRVSIASDYYNNMFDNLTIEPIGNAAYHITRIDDHDASIHYAGEWEDTVPVSYNEFFRTTHIADASTAGSSSFTFSFTGTEFSFVGASADAAIEIEIDGVKSVETLLNARSRQTSFKKDGLSDGLHTVTATVLEGRFVLDAIEVA